MDDSRPSFDELTRETKESRVNSNHFEDLAEQDLLEEEKSQEDIESCPVCGRSFAETFELKGHGRGATPEIRLSGDYCVRMYESAAAVFEH